MNEQKSGMRNIEVKMAKASREDIQKVISFFNFVEEFVEYGTRTTKNEDGEENSVVLSDEQFIDLVRDMWGGRFKPDGVDCAWGRVVFGCEILIDNCCDPESDCLELRKDWVNAIQKKPETKEPTWRPATTSDVGRLARFADRRGDHWTYGMLANVELINVETLNADDTFDCLQMDNDETEQFFICEVQDV